MKLKTLSRIIQGISFLDLTMNGDFLDNIKAKTLDAIERESHG